MTTTTQTKPEAEQNLQNQLRHSNWLMGIAVKRLRNTGHVSLVAQLEAQIHTNSFLLR